MSKLATARRLYTDAGWQAVIRHACALTMTPFRRAARSVRRWLLKNDHWLVGKWVELTGNRVQIDGCSFSLDHPSISCRLKSRFVLGLYEASERTAMKQFLDPQLPVVELGGGIGVVSCTVNRRLLEPSQHVVVEANPALLGQIEKNRLLNAAGFELIHAAVGYDAPEVGLNVNGDYLSSSVHGAMAGQIQVPATSLRQILDARNWPVATLICDIEGAEFNLLERESDVLRSRIQLAIFEAHEVPEIGTRNDFARRVEALGFERLWEGAGTYVFRRIASPTVTAVA